MGRDASSGSNHRERGRPAGSLPDEADVPRIRMSHYDDSGQKSSGPTMGAPENHHVVCRDCAFEEICSTDWAAESVARTHRGETAHETTHARIE
jgi:hypothetical protein